MAYPDLCRNALLKVEAEGLESNLFSFAQGLFSILTKFVKKQHEEDNLVSQQY
jgi:hypothetical protein